MNGSGERLESLAAERSIEEHGQVKVERSFRDHCKFPATFKPSGQIRNINSRKALEDSGPISFFFM